MIVGSEEIEGGQGFDYTTAFSALATDPGRVTPQALAAGMVHSYQEETKGSTGGTDTESAMIGASDPGPGGGPPPVR